MHLRNSIDAGNEIIGCGYIVLYKSWLFIFFLQLSSLLWLDMAEPGFENTFLIILLSGNGKESRLPLVISTYYFSGQHGLFKNDVLHSNTKITSLKNLIKIAMNSVAQMLNHMSQTISEFQHLF